jgi:peptide/nickel transport system substrate-binding protein
MSWLNRCKKLWLYFSHLKSPLNNLAKKQVWQLNNSGRWPSWRQWRQIKHVLSKTEKIILATASTAASISILALIILLVIAHRSKVPAVGGEYTEGLVGAPQFINPLYSSVSDVDTDLTKLIYSGLFKWTEDNGLTSDLADSYIISDDQKTYTIKIRDNAKWHNGDPVRSSDVLFTIQSIQNPAYHSPLVTSFRGVMVSEVDEHTVQFVLDEPFNSFLSTLTVGILPSSLWAELAPKNIPLTSLNLTPIGSGPYKFEKYTIEKSGKIHSYIVSRFDDYYNSTPKIEKIIFKFYPDIETAVTALENQNIEGLGFVPGRLVDSVKKNHSINFYHPSLFQEVALFFNQESQPLLKDKNIRQALALSIDKEAIITSALNGNGTVINTPLLPGTIGYFSETATTKDLSAASALISKTDYIEISTDGYRAKKTKKTENGQTVDSLEELTFNLTTINQPEFIQVAQIIVEQAKLAGIKIQIETVAVSDFYNDVIKPRHYQILLTAIQFGLDSDPYSFWHSSQANDPGLNLSLYVNKKVDDLLEKARVTNNSDEQAEFYKEFQNILIEDLPAIFLYQPTYTYAVNDKIKNLELNTLYSPADRFQKVSDWYIKTKQVFK